MGANTLTLPVILLRVGLALALGGALGLERGRKNRPAGFRTYILVCLGSALVMMTNQYVYETFATSDPVRLGAQVISGIGFLGAGTILVTGKNQVKGITTAAGLWVAACCGLAIGIGFYAGAILGGTSVFLVMTSLQHIDGQIRKHAKILDVYIEFDRRTTFSTFISYLRQNGVDMSDIQLTKNKYVKEIPLCVVVTLHSTQHHRTEIEAVLHDAPGVVYYEELL